MKLGKTLDLSKCFYDKDHWSHPDLKEGQLYIAYRFYEKWKKGIWMIGTFKTVGIMPYLFFVSDNVHGRGEEHVLCILKNSSPIQEGWKHIQEVIV